MDYLSQKISMPEMVNMTGAKLVRDIIVFVRSGTHFYCHLGVKALKDAKAEASVRGLGYPVK